MARAKGDRKQFDGYSSNQIHNLRLKAPKVWNWVEWVLSDACDKQNLKKDVVICLLNKLLPSKIEGNIKLEGELAYAQRVFSRLGIPFEMSDAEAN